MYDFRYGKCWNVIKSVICFFVGLGVREMLRLSELGLLEIMFGDYFDYEVKSLVLLLLLILLV